MTNPADMPPTQSGPHPQAQPNQNGGLARFVGSISGSAAGPKSGSGLGKSVWDKVDLAYRHLKSMGGPASLLLTTRAPNKGPSSEQITARAKQSDKIPGTCAGQAGPL